MSFTLVLTATKVHTIDVVKDLLALSVIMKVARGPCQQKLCHGLPTKVINNHLGNLANCALAKGLSLAAREVISGESFTKVRVVGTTPRFGRIAKPNQDVCILARHKPQAASQPSGISVDSCGKHSPSSMAVSNGLL